MNFVSKFDAQLPVDGPVAHSVMHAHVDGASTHAPSDAIIVPDAQLLFGGDFKRSGVDLVLSHDDRELVLHDYFKGEKRAALASPDGAHLTGDLVNALSGHVEYAQAGGGAAAAAAVVGHVTKLSGTATAIRNGVSIILNQGDNIDKGDVLQSGADSTIGVTFIDGTVFGLSSNARMVVNEMVYDPNGSNNSSLLSLVAGTISFVAGETAKHGDMKVDTPVATMGIRGTAVLVEIDFAVPGQNGAPSANFQVLMEPDGTTGSYILFDKNTLAPLATVNTAGTLTKISEGVVTFQAGSPLSPDEQKLIQDLFTQKFGDANPKLFDHFTDSIIPQSLMPIYLPGNVIATPVVLLATAPVSSVPVATSGPAPIVQHIPGAPHVGAPSQSFGEIPGISGSHTPHTLSVPITFSDPNTGDRPTVTVKFNSFTYQDAHGNNLTTLTPQEKAAIAAVEAISLQQNPGNTNNGSATWTYSFPDGAFDFLGAGQKLTLIYTALVDNNYLPSPETGVAQFTITITGTNDVPVITSSAPQTIAFVGGASAPGGDLTAHAPRSGTIAFDDPDLTDTHTVSVQLVPGGLNLPQAALQTLEKALTASIAADSTGTGLGTVNWQLADLPVSLIDSIPKGQTITLTYEVTVTDSQGATAIQDITVKITDAAEIWIATTPTGSPSGGLWSDGANWETGNVPTANDDVIIVTNQLNGPTPSYPVTIDAATAAVAKSVTMNDFATSPPELINLGSLTVGGAFDMSADSIFRNSGTVSVGGTMDVVDESVLLNSGALNLRDGGDFGGQSTIANTGTIEISGGTLTVAVGVANAGGIIDVDGAGTLKLDSGFIDGGVINDYSLSSPGSIVAGDIDVTGSSTISHAHLNNGNVTIASGQTLTLTGDTVTGTSFIDSADGAALLINGSATLDQVTITGGTITNSGATLTIDAGETLTLQDGASLVGGTLNNSGTLHIETSLGATLDGVSVTGSGNIQIDVAALAATLVLDDGTAVTGGTLTVGPLGTLAVKTAGGATLNGVDVTNEKSIEVFSGGVLTLDRVTTVDNSTGVISIDGTGMLTLDDASISGGAVINNGTLTLDGKAALKSGSLLNFSQVNVGGTVNELDNENVTNAGAIAILALGVLTLDHLATINNSGSVITVYGTGTLALNDATINGGTINNYGAAPSSSGSIVAGDIDVTGSSTIDVADLNNGQVTIESGVTLTLDDDTVTGTLFTDTAGGATIQVDGYTMLTLSDVTINGGTVNDFSADASGSVIAGDIDIAGSSTISGVHLNNGEVTIESGVVLTLDNDTVTGTLFTDTADGATIQVDGGTTLKLDGVTIDGGIINDFSTGASGRIIAGDIDITGSSIIRDASLNHGNVTIESGQELTLDGDTVNGTAFASVATGSVIHVDGGDTLTLNDMTTITGGGVTIDAGALIKTSGDVTLTNTSVTNDGKIEVADGILKITGSVGDSVPGGSGSIQIDNGAVLDLDASDAQNVAFSGDGGKLQIDTSSFGGSISGLTAGDQIDLSTIGYGLNTTGTYSNGVLTITDGVHSISMTLTGDYSNAHFAGSSDGHGGTLITLNANDDVPAIAAADKSESATVTELANITGSSALDPSPAASGTLHFTDIDLTDRPTVTNIAQSVTLTDGATTLSSGEIQALEQAFSLTQPVNTNNGSLGWTYQISDNTLDFLSAGEKATVTSTVTLDDHHGGTDTATVTVTIDGANDLPTIVAETDPSVQTVILNEAPIVLGAGITTNSLELPTETFDNLTAGFASINGFGHGNFTSTALDATFTASGAAGVVHGSSFVSAAPLIGPSPGHADSSNYLSIGARGSETIAFASEQNEFGLYWGSADSFNTVSFYDGNNLVASYSGADVAPLLANGNQGSGYVEFSDLAPFDKVVLESGSSSFEVDNISAGFVSDSHIHLADPITGTLTVSDADIGDTLTASVTGNAVAEYNGSTTLPSDVNVSALVDSGAITFDTVKTAGGQDVLDWTYHPTNADLDFLEPGDKLTLTFNAFVSDGHATTENQPLTVTLLGSNASIVNGTAQNDTFVNVGGGVKIFGNGGNDTFVFNKNFGSATIGDFNVNTDTIEIDKSLFATVSALLQGAQSANSGHDTVITDAAHDQITLSGVTLAQLQAHPNDFHLI